MRNLILGVIVAVWGIAAVIADLAGGMPDSHGAYGTGQTIGLVFAIFLIVIGIRALRKGLQERRG